VHEAGVETELAASQKEKEWPICLCHGLAVAMFWPVFVCLSIRRITKQVVKTIWQKGRIPAAYGRFNRIHQVALMCTPSNTCFLWPTRVHVPKDISIGSAVFAPLTAECPYIYSTMGRPFPPEQCPLALGDFDPRLIHGSLSNLSPHPERHVDRFRAHDRDRRTDGQTDRSRYSICNSRPHLRVYYCDAA